MVALRALIVLFALSVAHTGYGSPRPSEENIEAWDIETATGHLVAMFDLSPSRSVAYRYHVEGIAKGLVYKEPIHPSFIRWTAGDGEEMVCYMTGKTPGWVMFQDENKWSWVGMRTGDK
jgi:hypothetical protein